MNKCVCDICNKNESSNKFKVKQHMCVDYFTGKFGYRKIDICELCYHKLMRISADKKIEDEISKLIDTGDWMRKYEDSDMQSAYLDGFQTVLDVLTSQKIFKM